MKTQEQTKAFPVQASSHSHPTTGTFLKVGAILAVVTAMEWAVVSVSGMRSLVLLMLFVMSIFKFFLVVGYFMHLKFEKQLLGWTFAVGALLALGMTVAQVFVNQA